MSQTTKQLSFNFKLHPRLKTTELAWKLIVDKPLCRWDYVTQKFISATDSLVTPSWLGDAGFVNFVKDMGERPEGAIIVRINKNKIFCKSNCKWINWREYALLNEKIPFSRFTHCRLIRIERAGSLIGKASALHAEECEFESHSVQK